MKNRIQAALSRANDKTKGLSAEELSELSQEAYKGIKSPMDPPAEALKSSFFPSSGAVT